jgi:hypothetical protein
VTGRDDQRDVRQDADADLRAAFAALRREEGAHAPSFEAVLRGAARGAVRRRRPWLVPALTGTIAAAALVMAMIAVRHPPDPRIPAGAGIEAWTAPTDFLLETPGRDFLETVPRIGELPARGMGEAPDDGRDPRKRRSVSP